MKRIALLVLAVAANAIANEDEMIQREALDYETDVQTVKVCLDEAETTIDELNIARQKIKIKEGEDIDEETKKSLLANSPFVACMLEKKDWIKDSKLDVDKIVEEVEKQQAEEKRTPLIDKKVLVECLNSLNKDDELNRKQRAFGLMLCFQAQTRDKK
ncbi:ObirObp2 protein [Camponotus japonicus]